MNMSEETLNASKEEVSLWQIFTVFAKIGAFTIGGGYAMIPLIRDEMIKRDWMTDEELPDIIAMAQSAPGVLAVNMSIFVGHKLHGVKGSVVATLGSVLPSFITILLIAMIFTNFRDNPVVERIFKGIRPVVVSLIAVPMINMARKNNKTWWAWAYLHRDTFPRGVPELLSDLHPACTDRGFGKHCCHQKQKGG